MLTNAIAFALSAGRAALGVGLLVAPGRIAEGWIGPDGADEPAGVLARSVGARDVVLGTGAMVALAADSPAARPWLAGQALADAGDFVATLLARETIPAKGVRSTLLLAGGSAVIAAFAAARS